MVLEKIRSQWQSMPCKIVIEDFDARGMPAGHDVIQTLKTLGRIEEMAPDAILIRRQTVKLNLCGEARAKDVNVNAAIRARIIEMHNLDDEKQVKGTKKAPGPCYGMKSHTWPALGVVLTYLDQLRG